MFLSPAALHLLQGGWEAPSSEPSTAFADGDGWDTGSQLPGGSVHLGLSHEGEGLAALASEVIAHPHVVFRPTQRALYCCAPGGSQHTKDLAKLGVQRDLQDCPWTKALIYLAKDAQPAHGNTHLVSCRSWQGTCCRCPCQVLQLVVCYVYRLMSGSYGS